MVVYSQASNGKRFATSGVDHATGVYSHRIPLLTLAALDNDCNEVTREFALSYSTSSAEMPTQQVTMPYGLGWSLDGESSISSDRTLTLSDGRSFHYTSMTTGASMEFNDKKTKDFNAVLQENTDVVIYYKDGVVEVLYDETGGNYRVAQIVFPNGELYTIKRATIGTQHPISEITTTRTTNNVEETTTMMSFEFGDSTHLSSVTVWQGWTTAVRSFSVQLAGNYSELLSYTQLAESEEAGAENTVSFTNDTAVNTKFPTYRIPTSISSSEGFTETIKYDPDGHKMNQDGTPKYSPRVLTYTADPGIGRAALVESYEYDPEHNYLGNPNSYDYSGDQADNLYKYGGPDTYSYYVTVTSSDDAGGVEQVSTQTYNTFHLMTSEKTVRQKCVQETVYTYPFDDNPDTVYEDQPFNILNPSNVQKKFSKLDDLGELEGEVKTFDTGYTYDEWGNQTYVLHPSGVEETIVYYDPDGENGCPADPFGYFCRFMKSHTSTGTDGTKKVKNFTYQSCAPYVANEVGQWVYVGTVVKPLGMTLGDGTTNAFSVAVTCQNNPTEKFVHNFISQVIISMPGPDENTPLTKTCDIVTSTPDGMNITISKTVTGHDGTSFNYAKTVTAYTALLTSITDRYGVTHKATYHATGDVASATSDSGTDYEKTVTYTYCDLDEAYGGPTVVQEDSVGTKQILVYNGKGDLVQSGRTMRSPLSEAGVADTTTFYITMEQTFDEFGRSRATTETDFKQDKSQMYSTKVTTSYDGWGLKFEEKSDDNVVIRNVNDPLTLSSKRTTVVVDDSGNDVESLATTETIFSLSKKPVSMSKYHVDAPDTPITTTMTYTGLGLNQSVTSPTGQTMTLSSFDLLDRVLTFTDSLGRNFSVDYAEGSPKSGPKKMSLVDGGTAIILGEQTQDGIGRVTSRTVAGRVTSAEFSGGMVAPNKVTTPAGNSINFTFNPTLSTFPDTIEEMDSAGAVTDTLTFSYADKTSSGACGKLLGASNSVSAISTSYTPDGQKISQLQNVTDPALTGGLVTTECTLLGKPITQTLKAPSGDIAVSCTYDGYGRVATKTQGSTKVEIGYDNFGRLISELVKTSEDVDKQLTELTLDDMGRETSRTITEYISGGSTSFTIDLGYDDDDKIISKTSKVNGDTTDDVKLEESFIYDSANRLVSHTIAAGYDPNYLPVAGFNVKFTKQTLAYNIRDNITSITSTLEDDTKNIATFIYDTDEPTKLISISNTSTLFPTTVLFTYDSDGNVIEMTAGDKTISMTYTASGRLASYNDGETEQAFKYDALQRLVTNGSNTRLYADGQVFAEKNESDTTEFMRAGTHVVSERDSTKTLYVASDNTLSAIAASDSSTVTGATFSPFGSGETPGTRTGYAGEITVRGTTPAVYPLGNGTRVYFPELQMFSSPDGFAPFSGGGIHPYMYCTGNPLNMMDPSGHKGFFKKLFHDVVVLIVDVVVVAVEVASVVASGGASIPAVIAITAGVLAVTADTLTLAADSLSAEDANQGTDHSQTISNLNIASHAFSTASNVVSMGESPGKKHESGKKERYKSSASKNREKASDMSKSGCTYGASEKSYYTKKYNKKAEKYDNKVKKITDDERKDMITGDTMGREMLATSVGLDMDSARKAMDRGLPLHKRALHGAWATYGVVHKVRGYKSGIEFYSSLGKDDDGGGDDNAGDDDKNDMDDGEMTRVSDSVTNGYPLMEA